MKIAIFLILVLSALNGSTIKAYKYQLSHLTENQIEVKNLIAYNASKYDLKFTMLAIAFRESQFGKYKLNLADPSAGIFHQLLPTYCKELGLRPNSWNQSRVAERLINSNALALHTAINHFKRDYSHFKLLGYSNAISWRKAVMAYNAGIYNYKAGYKYYKEIVKIIKALHQLEY